MQRFEVVAQDLEHREQRDSEKRAAHAPDPTPDPIEEGQQEEPREGSGVHCEVVFYPLLHLGGILKRDWIMNRVGLIHR